MHQSSFDTEFHFDQERALNELCNLEGLAYSCSRYILIHAPAGYGKSHLLRHFILRIKSGMENKVGEKTKIDALPEDLLADIKHLLASCDEFTDTESLRSIFFDRRIAIWRDDIPEAHGVSKRVDSVIDFLGPRYNSNGENALILFLQVLHGRYNSNDGRYNDLAEFIRHLSQLIDKKIESSVLIGASLTWHIRQIDCAKATENQIPDLCRLIGIMTPVKNTDVKELFYYVRDEIIKNGLSKQGGHPAVLLIFDSLDRLSPVSQNWLLDSLHELDKATRKQHGEQYIVRIILSGRNAEEVWNEYRVKFEEKMHPKRIPYRPFDKHDIQQWLWQKAQAMSINLPYDFIISVTDEIYQLSGGHPAVVKNIINNIASELFSIDPEDFFHKNRYKLIQENIAPFVIDFLNELSSDVKEYYQALSIFRCLDSSTIEFLKNEKILSSQLDAVSVLGSLCSSHLLDEPDKENPFYHDHLMQKLVSLVMMSAHLSENEPQVYRHINKLACTLYNKWIIGGFRDDEHSRRRKISIAEWFFHSLAEENVDFQALRTQLNEYFNVLSKDNEQKNQIIRDVLNLIDEDPDLTYLLNRYQEYKFLPPLESSLSFYLRPE